VFEAVVVNERFEDEIWQTSDCIRNVVDTPERNGIEFDIVSTSNPPTRVAGFIGVRRSKGK
jgi:hypothetical protein